MRNTEWASQKWILTSKVDVLAPLFEERGTAFWLFVGSILVLSVKYNEKLNIAGRAVESSWRESSSVISP